MRYYLQFDGKKWVLSEQRKQGEVWTDVKQIKKYDTFDEGLAMADTYSPLTYDESWDLPKKYRSEEVLKTLEERKLIKPRYASD